jgi:nucleoside-triphosphatase THEP1
MQNYTYVSKLEEDVVQFQDANPLLRTIELNTALSVLDKGQNIWITGHFGSGKTYLLLLIENKLLANKVRVHKINMAVVNGEADFFESLYDYLKIKKKQRTPADIIWSLEKQRLVLLVDEFGVIENNPSFSETFSTVLRHIVDNSKLQLVITSQKLIDQSKFRGSPLTNIFVHISLSPLTNEAASSMLKEIAATAGVKLDESYLQKAVELTQGSPRNIYRLGSLLAAKDTDLDKVLKDFGSSENSPQENLTTDISEKTPTDIIRQYGITEDALDKHVATDKPIQSVKQDKLDFKIYVNALHSFILSKYTTTPITISIDGVWGTGKSSLMSMLKGKLDPQRDRVRKFFEWWSLVLPKLKWCLWFIFLYPAKSYGKTLITLNVRKDVDDDNVYLYFGQKYPRVHKYFSDIVTGFSFDPEALNQPDFENVDKWVKWWAFVNAKSEPMEPPYHYTVWLNAWKFDNQEEVWASLALATMEQIKQKHGLFWRLRFWLELTFSRFSFWSGLWQVVKQFLLPLIFAAVLATYNTIIESVTTPLDAFTQYGSPLLWAGFVISGILSISSIFKDPFQIPLEKVFDSPNYKDKVKFLTHFEKDFARIVRAAIKNGFGWKRSKLVIFIDDLDRCEPPRSADIVEAINLFLDAEGCVFVIGMDSESVARSIEVKYKDLFERMRAENTGVVSLGRLFLDKIVQIPFSVPRATPQQITNMVNDALGAKVLSLSLNISIGGGSKSPSTGSSGAPVIDANSGQMVRTHAAEQIENILPIIQPRIDPASYTKPEVRAAILKGTKLLADNPRQVKTFINLFRLSIYIANERKILEEKIIAEQASGLNLEKLATWTACSIRWSGLVRHLYAETQTDSLCKFIHNVSEEITPEFGWKTGNKNIPTEFRKKLDALRKSEKSSEAHWCHLPWDWWLLEPDFLKVVKLMENIWALSTGELEVLLNMSRPLSPTYLTEAK